MKPEGLTYRRFAKGIMLVALVLAACGTVASVTPLGPGRNSVTLSSGGPVAPVFDIQMPIPYSVIRYRHGMSEEMDIHCGIHPAMYILCCHTS